MAIAAPVGRYNWIKVVDLMTRYLLTVTPVETIGQADELMNTNKIRQLPVVQGKDLVGIVTDRDISLFPQWIVVGESRGERKGVEQQNQRHYDYRAHHPSPRMIWKRPWNY